MSRGLHLSLHTAWLTFVTTLAHTLKRLVHYPGAPDASTLCMLCTTSMCGSLFHNQRGAVRQAPTLCHRFYGFYESLRGPEAKVAQFVGLSPQYIMQQHMGAIRRNAKLSHAQREADRIAKRFYAALALNDLIQEVPTTQAAEKYGLQRGQLQGLQERAGVVWEVTCWGHILQFGWSASVLCICCRVSLRRSGHSWYYRPVVSVQQH